MSIGIQWRQRHQLTDCWRHVASFARLLRAAKQSRPALDTVFILLQCKQMFLATLASSIWSPLLRLLGYEMKVGVLFFFLFFFSVYLKFQSNRSRATLFIAAVFSFSSHLSFNFKLSPALCLQAICVLWTMKRLCQKEAFLSSLPPVTELLLDNCN